MYLLIHQLCYLYSAPTVIGPINNYEKFGLAYR